ncbi:MAG: glycosyltransferase family 4 protein [Prevotellaceae bacterium]|jgi:glycosyltransferase involved in cell wall biosynthesis|nr:glycosyltransferase family 4 protein [Prevotellaceae bacterium]
MKTANKLFRLTTIPTSLDRLLKSQLRFLNQYYDVTAIASDDRETWHAIELREGVKCKIIHMERDISIFNDLKSLIALYRFFRKERPAIVHANTPKASLLSMLAAKLAGTPHRIYTVTGLRFESETGLKRKILILMEKITCRAATNVIPEGQGVEKTLRINKITNKPLKVIANGNINGIDTDYFSPVHFLDEEKNRLKSSLKIQPDDIVFCFVGRLVMDKGINELVQTFSEINQQYHHTKLLLVGDFEKKLDPLLPKTEQEMNENANIIFVGYQPDVRPYLAISDVFTFPSYREGFPNVVMQAGAMELPSIVTDINGCNEIIADGVNGLIIPSKNKEQLKEKMILLLENRDLRNHLKQNARRMITSRYEQQMVWDALLEEYQKLENNV